MVKGINFFAVILLFFVNLIHLDAQSWDWLQTIHPGGDEYVWDLASDKQGNILATGRVKAYSTFGSGIYAQSPTPVSLYETDMFIAKYRSNGNLVWVKRQGGNQPDWGRAVASDDLGNIYVAGDYCDTANFGTHQVIAAGAITNRNIFFAKYDSTGNCLWVKSAGNASGYSRGYGVTLDSIGNSYVTGYISGVVNFDTVSFGVAGFSVGFVAKFDQNGNCLWGKIIPVSVGSNGNDINIDKYGDLLVCGDYRGNLYINGVTYPGNSPSWGDVYLIKMNTSGSFIWAKTAIGAYQDEADAVVTDSIGNVYIAGTFCNDLTFGTTVINSLGWGATAVAASAGADGFLTKYDKNGNFQWVKTIGNIGLTGIGEIGITPSNKVLVSGAFYGNTDMAGSAIIADTTYESSFITAFDISGNVLWYKINGGNANSQVSGNAVCSDAFSNCYVGGEVMGNAIDFDTAHYSSFSGWDGYLAKLFPPLTPVIIGDTIICPTQNVNFSVNQDGYPITYQWIFAGGTPSTSSIANPIVNYPTSGIYAASLIISNAYQTDTITQSISVIPGACTFVQEDANIVSVKISPNPASESVRIELSGLDFQKNITFQLYNYLGQKIGASVLINENMFNLNLETIPSGGYFFNIIQDHSLIKTGKLIILNR